MEESKIKLAIGFITYGKSTAKYLPYFLPSLKNQSFKDFSIIVFDNTEIEENENVKYIRENYPEIKIMRTGENLGFGRSYNKMIEKAKEIGAKYFLAINPDMILEPDAVKKMAETMDNNSNLGSVSPKVLKWRFEDNVKTNIIDTCGVLLKPGLRFVNAGEGQKDWNNLIKILGPAGTVAIYRMNALEKVKEDDKYFDELMFMYKEDCDLAYRLKLAGFKSKCVSDAIVYHDRSASAKGESDIGIALNRRNKNKQVKKWSFLGQQIIFAKYWRLQNFKNKFAIVWYQIKMLVFILLFEQYLLKELINLYNIKKKIKIYK
jgi:GT2 family glycosyltransferase